MKRRAGDAAKLRRPLKRNKLSDGIYSTVLLYLKFFLLWAIIILADFILEFRFEFLWPFWMLLRSVYDSFKYQGLAFSIFFVCIALTSDMICFFFIPVQWIFFAASTYVWVQYIWYTEKGICLPTMILCSVFVYMEAGVRLRDLRHVPAHLDLCRPFAAHCIGYPVVTLGFGFKSYISYKMRKRRQREVARENSFYMQLLQQALPPREDGVPRRNAVKEPEKGGATVAEKNPDPHCPEKQMNGNAVHFHPSKNKKPDGKNNQQNDKVSSSSHNQASHNHNGHQNHGMTLLLFNFKDAPEESGPAEPGANSHRAQAGQIQDAAAPNRASSSREKEKESGKNYVQNNQSGSAQNKHAQSNGVAGHLCDEKSFAPAPHQGGGLPKTEAERRNAEFEKPAGAVCAPSDEKEAAERRAVVDQSPNAADCGVSEGDVGLEKNAKGSSKSTSKSDKSASTVNATGQREERRRNKNKDKENNKEKESGDASQKHSEQNDNNSRSANERALRAALAAERQARAEITQLRQQNEQLVSKINTLNAGRQADRASLAAAERRLNEERRARQAADARHHQLRGMHKSGECVWDWCRQRRTALEQEVASSRDELQQVKDHNQSLQQSLQAAEQQVSTLEARVRENGADTWVAALTSLRERSLHLERSLSAETRVKLDLFSAVGEAKRQLGLREGVIRAQEKEIDELKGKIAQMVAVMPNDSFSPGPASGMMKLRLSDGGVPCYPPHMTTHHNVNNTMTSTHTMGNNVNSNPNNNMSNLDPNATAYTPKGSIVQCGPATEA